jgi:Fe2+ or Zn2+ uptake regulation protein
MKAAAEASMWDELRIRLRERGKRMTPQRIAVLEALRATASHPTAEELRVLVQEVMPKVSLGTVYRNLHLLVEEGWVRRLPTPQGSHRFDADLSAHLHVICRECGRISDVHLEIDSEFRDRVSSLTGYREISQHVEFRGVCPGCRAGSRPVKKRR